MVTEDEKENQEKREDNLKKITEISKDASKAKFRDLSPEEKNYVKKQIRGIEIVQKKRDNSNGNKKEEEIQLTFRT